MKKISAILTVVLALALALTAVGCAAEPAPSASPDVPAATQSPETSAAPEATDTPAADGMTAQSIAEELLAMENQFGAMADMGQEMVSEMSGLDYDMLEEYSINDAMMNIKSHILYVVKLKDEADLDAVKTAFQTRLELMQQNFATYLPDQYELAMDGRIEVEGKYVMLLVSEDMDAVVERFHELAAA